jgi:Ca-activated chloride channel family protein
MKKVSKVIRSIICVFLLTSPFLSCGGSRIQVAYGNYKYAQGKYGQATISYMRALRTVRDRSVLFYNLGNVYHALGETDSATNTLSQAVSVGEWDELESRANFNLGSIYYELGEYKRAAERYIASLVANPNDIDAKINLELALKRMRSDAEAEAKTDVKPDKEKPLSERNQKILRLIQRREEESWRSKRSSDKSKVPVQGVQEDW